MDMVNRLEGAGLVVDEKLDMIIEHLERQEARAAKLELPLAEHSESIAEVCSLGISLRCHWSYRQAVVGDAMFVRA